MAAQASSNLNDPAWAVRLRQRFEGIVGKRNVVPIHLQLKDSSVKVTE